MYIYSIKLKLLFPSISSIQFASISRKIDQIIYFYLLRLTFIVLLFMKICYLLIFIFNWKFLVVIRCYLKKKTFPFKEENWCYVSYVHIFAYFSSSIQHTCVKALLDARVGLHESRVRLAQNLITTSPTLLKQRVAIILKSGSRV